MTKIAPIADARPGWVHRTPAGMRPYLELMRVDRPVGVWLLFWPCVWGVLYARTDAMTAGRFWELVILFGLGAFAMRSAGCVWNDYVDRHLDAKVARTRSRPLASGRAQPWEALALIAALCSVGLAVLTGLPLMAALVAFGAVGLVAAYPFMKRITWWPQAWLGLTFNWGVLVGAAAVSGAVTPQLVAVYAAGVAWTLGYDTIYALQDIEDDAMAGIKSSARRLGRGARQGVAVFYGVTFLLIAAVALPAGGFWAALLLLPAAGHLAWQVTIVDPKAPETCLHVFKSNQVAGLLLALPALAV